MTIPYLSAPFAATLGEARVVKPLPPEVAAANKAAAVKRAALMSSGGPGGSRVGDPVGDSVNNGALKRLREAMKIAALTGKLDLRI